MSFRCLPPLVHRNPEKLKYDSCQELGLKFGDALVTPRPMKARHDRLQWSKNAQVTCIRRSRAITRAYLTAALQVLNSHELCTAHVRFRG